MPQAIGEAYHVSTGLESDSMLSSNASLDSQDRETLVNMNIDCKRKECD